MAIQSLFNPSTAQELINRLQQLQPQAEPQWGKMNVAQMLAHCKKGFQFYFGEFKIKRSPLGYIIGGMVKKRMLTDQPWGKSLPTARELLPPDTTVFEDEKQQLIYCIHRFVQEGRNLPPINHPFFGRMTTEEWGLHAYKHTDHHLRQFGV